MLTTQTTSPISFSRRGLLTGSVLGGILFCLCCLFYRWQDGIALALLFPAVGALRIQPKRSIWAFCLTGLWALVCIGLVCALPTYMVSTKPFLGVGSYRVVMNFLCVAVVCGVFLVLTGRIRWAVSFGTGVLMLLATASGYLYEFRGNLLQPADFFAIKTAMNVAGQYTYAVPRAIALCWFWWGLALFVLLRLPDAVLIPKALWRRLGAAGLTVVTLAATIYGIRDVRPNTWSNEGATRNGYFLNFAVGLRDCFPGKPEGYGQEALDALAQAYPSSEASAQKMPNVLVVMNESYADFSILGSPLNTNQPVTPFADSLQENTQRGHALCSVFGGGTANSEFEFLTGLSMGNLPAGACAYQQYIHAPIPSLVHHFNSLGYRTMATHPFLASGWNRTAVYPRLGFQEMTFIEDYPYEDVVREYISDRETYDYMLRQLAQSQEQPLFLFGITMQNHGDYIYQGDNYTQSITLTDAPGAYPMAEQYLSLLHTSDEALAYFLAQLADFPEDTVVLFFGDHFPQVEGDFFQDLHGGPFEGLSQQLLQFTVPCFLWANFDIPETSLETTSLNYLGVHLLEAAGLPLPPFYQFLKQMEQTVPALNSQGYYSQSAQTYLPLEDALGEEARWLNQYAILQHNILFDQASCGLFQP